MATATARVTPDELLVMPDGKDFELVDGELRGRSMSTLSSFVAIQLATVLNAFVRENRRGWVLGADNGFQCFPHEPTRVRRPDVSFVSIDRMSADEIGDGWTTIAPDLAVEVVSPRDGARDLEEKLGDYRAARVVVVWVIYPETRTAYVHRGDAIERLSGDVEFVGEGALDGFRCRLIDLLPSGSTEG